ncbi:MAG: hypothetical protein GXP39_08105 [Chloroflexi bacterium]|nr:hypothetical protein [Chloroflexota bacterium]
MGIKIGDYTFEGPYTDTSKLQDHSGVYAIICYQDQRYHLVDVGESANVKERVENHDRKECWSRNCPGTLMFSVLYTPNLQQPGRKKIEQDVRNKFNPPCGEK